MKLRQWVLFMTLAATIAAALYSPQAPSIVEARVPPASVRPLAPLATPVAMPAGSLVASLRDRSGDEAPEESLFAPRDWRPPAPVAPPPRPLPKVETAPPPPPAPTVPPIPFRYLGRYEAEGGLSIFLDFQQQSLVARVGETLANSWKVESIEANRMVLTYLPMNEKRTLEWPATP